MKLIYKVDKESEGYVKGAVILLSDDYKKEIDAFELSSKQMLLEMVKNNSAKLISLDDIYDNVEDIPYELSDKRWMYDYYEIDLSK